MMTLKFKEQVNGHQELSERKIGSSIELDGKIVANLLIGAVTKGHGLLAIADDWMKAHPKSSFPKSA